MLLPLGVVPEHPAGSGAWWLTRFAAVAVLAVVLAPLVAVAGRVERRPSGPVGRPRHPWAPVLAVPLLAGACALITLDGLSGAGPLGIPVLPAALFTAGTALTYWRSDPAPEGEI